MEYDERPYLYDFIEIDLFPTRNLKPAKVRDLWERMRLSKRQIATECNVSISTVGNRLRESGIHGGTGKGRSSHPENYRLRRGPYGYKVLKGKLVINKSELKICRLVVEHIQRQGQNNCAVARELSERGFRNRAGKTNWNSKTVFNIFHRWKDKI